MVFYFDNCKPLFFIISTNAASVATPENEESGVVISTNTGAIEETTTGVRNVSPNSVQVVSK